jgi:hypothetical protein
MRHRRGIDLDGETRAILGDCDPGARHGRELERESADHLGEEQRRVLRIGRGHRDVRDHEGVSVAVTGSSRTK